MHQPAAERSGDVQRHEAGPPDLALDVRRQPVQGEHVAQQVQWAAVQERGRQQAVVLAPQRHVGVDLGVVAEDARVAGGQQVGGDVECDERVGDLSCREGGAVMQGGAVHYCTLSGWHYRYHASLFISSSLASPSESPCRCIQS